MEFSDLSGVFFNHVTPRKNEKTGKEYVTFSIAYSEKNGKDKFKTSFIDGIASFDNVVKKIKGAHEKERFVVKGAIKSSAYKTAEGKNTKQIVLDVHRVTRVESIAYEDPYENPNARLLQDDPYERKTYATMPGDVEEGDLPF